MPRKKKLEEAPVAPLEEASQEEAPVAEAPNARVDQSCVNVFGADREVRNPHGVMVHIPGGFIRQFSREVHGDDFVELAKGFAKKKGGRYEFPILR